MNDGRIHLGGAHCHFPDGNVEFRTVDRKDGRYVCIDNVDRMDPFFISLVSDGDHWVFVGSNGPFTAGRTDPDRALFPYQTADKILRHPDSSGAMTVLLVERPGGWARWEPWQPGGEVYRLERNLYKHAEGVRIEFEEINHDLGLRFTAGLTTSNAYGLVRDCRLENLGDAPVTVRYLDGWRHLIAPGIGQDLYAQLSYLAAAYLRHEQDPETGMGIFTLNARLTDRAEPAESLRAACAWSLGHQDPVFLLSERQVAAFRRGEPIRPEPEVRGEFGAYLAVASAVVAPRQSHRWSSVADTHLDHAGLITIREQLRDPAALERAVAESVTANAAGLRRRIAAADGLQETADSATCVHHFANALFNCMRGGTFADGYRLPTRDFAAFLAGRNRSLHQRHRRWLAGLPEYTLLAELVREADALEDPQLARLAREYLPLTFSRRHGDPSRPWNRFAIRIKDEQGQPVYAYQGNWRDIFQNWESLGWSFPGYLESMIAIFLNASTADGYNPYRITREGIDWEVEDPADPWGHIGYWGDHQVVYLLRLLETAERFFPGALGRRLRDRGHAYAQVPYRIAGFDAIVADPRHTIRFDHALHARLTSASAEQGADAKLHCDDAGEVILVTLAEKLLAPLLVKLTNLVPEGGIWLNTQRPEWNDANNALAGYGLSMVTVCYLRRYLDFCGRLFTDAGDQPVELTAPVAELLEKVTSTLRAAGPLAARGFTDAERFQVMASLGRAGETHRDAVYQGTWSDRRFVGADALHAMVEAALPVVDASIRANRRDDGLYHSYNVLRLGDGPRAAVDHLYPMLEGQVAVISSGLPDADETLAVVQALRASDLYREDQQSYLLYPDQTIPPFLSRNTLPRETAAAIPLLAGLVAAGDRRLVVADAAGNLHFQADLTNASDVSARLGELAADPRWQARIAPDTPAILDLWEQIFRHRFFTGRSGTMFAFEGLGSIYWHMVAKLLLAVQEVHRRAAGNTRAALAEAYHEIRRGLGFTKSPAVYGAFPSDPYSHSPRHRGAQQPGMTGQVKEEILTRWGELGIRIEGGCLAFAPELLPRSEFFAQPHRLSYIDPAGVEQDWQLPAESLGFTFCQVPITYQLADDAAVSITYRDGSEDIRPENRLSPDDSRSVFLRDHRIARISVHLLRTAR